jgi:hypothetical protein
MDLEASDTASQPEDRNFQLHQCGSLNTNRVLLFYFSVATEFTSSFSSLFGYPSDFRTEIREDKQKNK